MKNDEVIAVGMPTEVQGTAANVLPTAAKRRAPVDAEPGSADV